MRAPRFASALATFIAGCALALVVAYWSWQIAGPAALHIAAQPPADPAATIIAADLFNAAGVHAPAGTPAASVLSGDARLVGIVAQPLQHGYALFRFPAGTKLVAQGEQIAPGVTLTAIEPFAITIRDGAGERRFVLHESAAATPPAASAAPGRNTSPASSAPRDASRTASCAPPAGFHGNVVRINAELLGGLAGEAGPWRTLLAPATGGLVVREEGGFGAMLGLKAGDRIAQANGIALRVPDDVTAAVIRPLLGNQGVRIVGSRGGTKHELWLANIACAGKR
jgi:hypothetical protein